MWWKVCRLVMMRLYSHLHPMSVIIAQSIHTIVFQTKINYYLSDSVISYQQLIDSSFTHHEFYSFLSQQCKLSPQSKIIFFSIWNLNENIPTWEKHIQFFFLSYTFKSYDKLIMTDQITNKQSWTCWDVLSYILYT